MIVIATLAIALAWFGISVFLGYRRRATVKALYQTLAEARVLDDSIAGQFDKLFAALDARVLRGPRRTYSLEDLLEPRFVKLSEIELYQKRLVGAYYDRLRDTVVKHYGIRELLATRVHVGPKGIWAAPLFATSSSLDAIIVDLPHQRLPAESPMEFDLPFGKREGYVSPHGDVA